MTPMEENFFSLFKQIVTYDIGRSFQETNCYWSTAKKNIEEWDHTAMRGTLYGFIVSRNFLDLYEFSNPHFPMVEVMSLCTNWPSSSVDFYNDISDSGMFSPQRIRSSPVTEPIYFPSDEMLEKYRTFILDVLDMASI